MWNVGFLSWLVGDVPEQRELAPIQPAQGSGVMPPPRSSADAFTTDQALTISAVYRAISIIGTAVSQLTLDVWRGPDQIDPKPALVRRPDVNMPLSAFLEMTVNSLAISGDAFWRLERNTRGEVTGAEVLNPWECFPTLDGKTLGWRDKKLSEASFYHLKLLRVPGRANGLGPIQACRLELSGVKDMRDFASGWFGSGDTPSGILKSEQPLSPEQAAAYKASWMQRAAHEVAILGSGLDYTPVLLSPRDAQFLEAQQFGVTQIARLFGIPANLLLAVVEGQSYTYTNVAQADLSFVRWTLQRYTGEIESALTSLLPGMQAARFNLDGLLRPDTKSRYEAHEIALRAGFLSVEEVRAIEGLEPMNLAPAPPADGAAT